MQKIFEIKCSECGSSDVQFIPRPTVASVDDLTCNGCGAIATTEGWNYLNGKVDVKEDPSQSVDPLDVLGLSANPLEGE